MLSEYTCRPLVLLLCTTTGYQTRDFLNAARTLGLDTLVGTDRCHVLGDSWIDRSISLRFEEPELCVGEILNASENRTIDAVIPIGDKVTVVAAQVAEVLGLRHHSPRGYSLARIKLFARR